MGGVRGGVGVGGLDLGEEGGVGEWNLGEWICF